MLDLLMLLQLVQRPKPSSWDDVVITLNHCPDDAILCGIDLRLTNVGDLLETLNNTYFRQLFRRSVSEMVTGRVDRRRLPVRSNR